MTSIRARLALGLVAGLALLLGAGGAALYFRTKASLERQEDAALLSKAWALASSVRVDEGEILFEPAPALAADFQRADRHAAYEIRRRNGSLFAGSAAFAETTTLAGSIAPGESTVLAGSPARAASPAHSASDAFATSGTNTGSDAHTGLDAHSASDALAGSDARSLVGEQATPIVQEPVFAWTTLREDRAAREVALSFPVLSEQADAHSPAADGASTREASITAERAVARESASHLSTSHQNDSVISTVHAGTNESPVEREVIDRFTIRVAEELPDTQAMLAGLRTTILAVITLAFLLSILLVQFVLGRGLSPLEAMAAQAQTIDAESLDRRFSKEPLPAELEPIRTRLNDLLDRLQQSFERERRFNAAVAHELRTPIAELRALSEIALRWPESADLKKNMTDVSAVAIEMQSVVEALLTLRRVESGLEKIELEPVRVDELVQATIAAYGKAAAARDQTLSLDIAAGVTIESHRPMLRSIVSNLVSNAIEYAPKGSTIAIACRADEHGFRFSTKNPAPELTPADVVHMFEPFWRKDSVRTTGSHAGLGLTLTQSFAQALGLRLRAELGNEASLEMILDRS